MNCTKVRRYRHADPSIVRKVWDTFEDCKNQRPSIPVDKINKLLRKKLNLKDDQIRLLLDEIEGDGLIEKSKPSFGKNGVARYMPPDFTKPCPRGKHDWYCFQCHRPGEVLRCSDCFRVYHTDCAQEVSAMHSPSYKSLRSPTIYDDGDGEFTCPVCKSRPKCEFSRKQIRKLLEFATHNLRKQPLWKMFLYIGYKTEITKNEYLVYKYTDLDLLHRKMKDGRFTALEEFSMDVQLLVHNVCILHGLFSTEADEIRVFLRSVNLELNEIQLCTDCYINAKARLSDWISKPCKPRHELIWARNRTPAGAGLFVYTSIAEYYWPAKILLERDDGYEIRFFGGTHERMFVKKIHTRPFHLPADEVGVFRRSTNTVNVGGGFERAWNEVLKLQANIDSGYYTHSSGESDLPPSDDEYSDELYLGPRRKILNLCPKARHPDSPRSSNNSSTVKELKRRRRNASTSSHQTIASATPITDSPSPIPYSSPPLQTNTKLAKSSRLNSHFDDKKRVVMPSVQPGTPGAAAISALAETKAAMAAAGSSRLSTFYGNEDFLSGTFGNQSKSKTSRTSNCRGSFSRKTGSTRGRLSLAAAKSSVARRRRSKYASSTSSPESSNAESSSLSMDSQSDGERNDKAENNHADWHSSQSPADWKSEKKKTEVVVSVRRGRPPKTKAVTKTVTTNNTNQNKTIWLSPTAVSSDGEDASDIWSKSGTSNALNSTASRGRSKQTTVFDSLTSTRTNKKRTVNIKNSNSKKPKRLSADEDDELTDRCMSPSQRDSKRSSQWTLSNLRSAAKPNTVSIQSSPVCRNAKSSPTKRPFTNTKRHSSHSSNCSTYSSSDDESGVRNTRIDDDYHRLRSPRGHSSNKDYRFPGTSSTMLRRPPFAPPLNASLTSSVNMSLDRNNSTVLSNSLQSFLPDHSLEQPSKFANSPGHLSDFGSAAASGSTTLALTSAGCANFPTTTTAISSLPRSHLPPNKRAAAAAAAAALNTSNITVSDDYQQSVGLRNTDGYVGVSGGASPKKLVHRGIQTPASMDVASLSNLKQPCTQCKERDAERLVVANEAKRALKELEDKLTCQFKEEKTAALQKALEQAQTSALETIEHERKLAQDTLEATEARFNEVIVQTKRRQWCRNCLSEAIYHCCWNTSYCSTQCQQEHWQKEHKRQCRRKR